MIAHMQRFSVNEAKLRLHRHPSSAATRITVHESTVFKVPGNVASEVKVLC